MSDEREHEVIPLSRLRATLAGPRGHRRVEALLAAPDAAAAVAALSVTELYSLVKEVGFGDCYEMLALATPTQLRGCLDLDLWERDRLEAEAAKPWLMAVIDAGFEKLGEVWAALDPELAALLLTRWTRVFDLTLGEDPDDHEERSYFTTPDTFFAVELTCDDDDTARLVHRLIEDLYRADMALAKHTLMSARSEPSVELEEMSYRWRTGRMADIGYVDFHEALEVYRPLDPDAVRIGEGSEDRFGDVEDDTDSSVPRNLPAPIADRVAGRSFLARALDRVLAADEARRLEIALVVLVNKVLAAARISPGDEEAVTVGAEHATATLALGLETVSGGDVERAAEALRTISLTRLHRLGHSVAMRLARLARAMAPRAAAADPSAAVLLGALARPRPLFPRELDVPPGVGPRPLESTEDVRRAAELLAALALRIAVAEALGVDLAAMAEHPEPRPELDDFVRTALVRALGGGSFDPAPLSEAEVQRFCTAALAGPTLVAAAREAAGRALLGALERLEVRAGRELLPALLEAWLRDLEETFGPLAGADAIDPRFVGGVILDGDRQ